MASPKGGAPNIYAYRGRRLLSQYHARYTEIPNDKLSELKLVLHNQPATSGSPVCIIGAGLAGLYTAMIFESLGISYQIVDANTEKRIGGRLFTYHFPSRGPYDYYDVGAMRFPRTPFMKRTFDLAEKRELPVELIPYINQMVPPSPNTFSFFNNARINNHDSNVTGDPFNVRAYVSDPNLRTPGGVSRQVATMIQPFRDLFRTSPSGVQPDIATSMEALFTATNKFSMRSYMFLRGMSDKDISWCETLDKSTGAYDRALTEIVIGSLAFNWPTAPLPGPEPPNRDPNKDWYCFNGGSSTLPNAMFGSLSESAQKNTLFNSPVTAISEDTRDHSMNISINGTPSSQLYSAVISTVPLPRLSLMDLTGVNINDNYAQWSAIRQLQYGPAIKVGIKFKCPWWKTELPRPIHGGQSYTDLPLRTIVYPSYPKDATAANMSPVLIVSYCRTQDAERMGTLINRDGTGQPELIKLVFHDLAAVHGVTVKWLEQYYEDSNENYYAWDWSRDPLSMGGFAFFGPGVYESSDIYSEMLQPAANGKLFFAGEATSTCHGWVSGALNSAWRAVDQYLNLNQPEDVRKTFWDKWGPTEYWDEASDKEFVELDRELMDRHLVIALYKSGVRLPEETGAETAAI